MNCEVLNGKRRGLVITFPLVLSFFILWQFFWSDNSYLRLNPYIFWPIVAAFSFIVCFNKGIVLDKYTKLTILSFITCILFSLFSSSKLDGILFVVEISLYFFAVLLVKYYNIDYIKITYGFCILHMVFLFMQRIIPSLFYSIVRFFSSSTALLLQQNAGIGAYYGFTGQTSTIAFYLLFGLVISLYYLTKKKKINCLFLIMAALFELAILLTNRRGALIVSIMIILVLLFLDRRNLLLKVFIVSVVLTLLFVIGVENIPGVKEIIAKFNNYQERNDLLSGRSVFWNYCIEMFKSSPLFGKGFGSFVQYSNFEVTTAHNSYVQKLGEMGLIGSVLFFAPHLYTLFVSIRGYISKGSSLEEKKYMLFGFLFLMIFFAEAIFEGIFETPILFVIIFMIEQNIVLKNGNSNKKRRINREVNNIYC